MVPILIRPSFLSTSARNREAMFIHPAEAFVYIPVNAAATGSVISIYNSKGLSVYTKEVRAGDVESDNFLKIEVKDFPQGIYFINETGPSGKPLHYKFMKK